MHLHLLAFAQLRDELGFAEQTVECTPEETPREIMARVAPAWTVGVVRAAVDREYHGWDAPLGPAQELALIPPVSGG